MTAHITESTLAICLWHLNRYHTTPQTCWTVSITAIEFASFNRKQTFDGTGEQSLPHRPQLLHLPLLPSSRLPLVSRPSGVCSSQTIVHGLSKYFRHIHSFLFNSSWLRVAHLPSWIFWLIFLRVGSVFLQQQDQIRVLVRSLRYSSSLLLCHPDDVFHCASTPAFLFQVFNPCLRSRAAQSRQLTTSPVALPTLLPGV